MSIPIHTMLQSIKEGDCCHFMVKLIFTQLYIKEYWWWINFYSQIITVPQRGWLLSLSGFTHLQTAVHQRVSVRTEPLMIFFTSKRQALWQWTNNTWSTCQLWNGRGHQSRDLCQYSANSSRGLLCMTYINPR